MIIKAAIPRLTIGSIVFVVFFKSTVVFINVLIGDTNI